MNENKWLSTYIFHNTSFDAVIEKLIRPTIEALNKKQLISAYFFIRYWENGPHIRLRVMPNNNEAISIIQSYINNKTNSYFQNLPSSKYRISFNQYVQEIQRYGGHNSIKLAEAQFETSSKVVLDFLKNNFEHIDYSLKLSYAMQLHIAFSKVMCATKENAIQFFDTIRNNWISYSINLNEEENDKQLAIKLKNTQEKFTNSYVKQKDTLDKMSNLIWNDPSVVNEFWFNQTKKLNKKLNVLLKQQKIIAPLWLTETSTNHNFTDTQILHSIFDSFIHMTNNRLGIRLADEAFIAFLISKSLKVNSTY